MTSEEGTAGLRVPVSEINSLAAAWAAHADGSSTAMSAVGLWPLLACLAAGAHGAARDELSVAVGLDAREALPATVDLYRLFDDMPDLRAALGIWVRSTVPLREEWREGLPASTVGELQGDAAQDQSVLNAWTSEQTGGMIRRMPLTVDQSTLMVLASALHLQTSWREKFSDLPLTVQAGPWAGRDLSGLSRSTPGLDTVSVLDGAAGSVTCLTVTGDHDVDVVLFVGENDASPGDVLAAGLSRQSRSEQDAVAVRTGSQLAVGETAPALTVGEVTSSPHPSVRLRLPCFSVRASHDLLSLSDLFGLTSATQRAEGHFPGISEFPLAVSSANQEVVAQFTAQGFEAAAVTAIGMVAAGMPPRYDPVRRIDVTLDRPFGFAALHRTTGLVLVAGWVADVSDFDYDAPVVL